MKIKFVFQPRELLFSIFLILIPVSLAIQKRTSISAAAYTDEILCAFCVFYIIYLAIIKTVEKDDIILLTLLIILSAIGMASNSYSDLTSNYKAIFIDFVCVSKMFVIFVAYKQIGFYDKKKIIIDYLVPASKLTILSAFFFSIISLFKDIGMSGEERYGIKAFQYFFKNEARAGLVIACALLILMVANTPTKKLYLYEFAAVVPMLLTTKGTVFIIILCYIILRVLWRNKTAPSLSIGNLALLGISGFLTSDLQINAYFRDSNSPRLKFIIYGFKTAQRYFPFGSGFATFGSDQAAKNYSRLYYTYGFNKIYGMEPRRKLFLNDCFTGMIMGQFGFFGFAIFVAMMIIIYRVINKTKCNNVKTKALFMAIFASIAISMIGTAIIKSSIGIFVLGVLGLVAGYSNNANTVKGEYNSTLKIRNDN